MHAATQMRNREMINHWIFHSVVISFILCFESEKIIEVHTGDHIADYGHGMLLAVLFPGYI